MSNTTARIAMTANASFPRALYRFAQRCGLPQGNAHIAQASEGAPCRQPARQNGPRDGNCQPGSRSFLACISGRIQKPAHPVSDAGVSSVAEPIRICRDEVRRISSICSDSAKRSADLRQVEVPQALAAPPYGRLAPIAERD
jgi:hypothetical protein